MRTAPALALFTFGAILAYAVNVSVPGVDVNTVGTVLALVGLLWLAVEIGIEMSAMRRDRPPQPRVPRRPDPSDRPSAPPYDPVLPPRADDGGHAGRRRPRS